MKKIYNKNLICLLALNALIIGCKKDFLNTKPSTTIIQPVTLNDFQSLLETEALINSTAALPVLSADEYVYIDYPTWQSTYTATERNTYIWEKNLFGGESQIKDWSAPYTAIFYANNVLSGLESIPITADNSLKRNFIKGWALFTRAYHLFDLTKNFCPAYEPSTAETDLGIPLKLQPEIDRIEQRSTLKETYDQILKDLNSARILLGTSIPTIKKNQPSSAAAYALQARIFLSMREYSKAELASDSCLALYAKLIDYRTISTTEVFPFNKANDETLYTTTSVLAYPASINAYNTHIRVDDNLYHLYEESDLRKQIYFKPVTGGYIMNGNYFGQGLYPYTGLATDEIYLIKAECAARRSDISESLRILNTLLAQRHPSSSFIPAEAETADQALTLVLLERRKELVWRGLRWDDLKRLNKEGAGIILTRSINEITYTLQPNDPKYVFPIPDDEIAMSGITQNIR